MRLAQKTWSFAGLALIAICTVVSAEEEKDVVSAAVANTASNYVSAKGKAISNDEDKNIHVRRRMVDRIHRRMKSSREMAERNIADLKMQYLQRHGKDLTNEMLEEAMREAREKAAPRFGEGWMVRLRSEIEGLEEYAQRDHVHPKTGRRLQQVAEGEGVIVSALSPGWPWNFGRNEFYCVGIREIKPPFLPKEGSFLTLQDCTNIPNGQLALSYTGQGELLFNNVDGVYWDWCAEAANLRNGRISIEKCDFQEPLQVWMLLDAGNADGTWRPMDDQLRCVTARPPQAGSKGGGILKIKPCSTRGKTRQAQTFVFCVDTTSCEINSDTGFIECDVAEECDPI